ncbi:MAG: ParB/RepB/Spo0J family partition protein [Acidobacteria bacterium]|nr:ParB/RepB/Spo0J family partition protein [Acidobacteriota bacterium]
MRHDSHYVDELSTAGRAVGRTLPIDSIEPNPEQPRSEFGDLTELSASIKEKGVLEPLLVQQDPDSRKWMIIAGERRWRASKLAGLTEVPCIEMNLDEKGIAEIALIENLQRKDLTVWEEADGLAALKEKFGYTQEQIAQKISKSRSTVTELMSIAGLPKEIRERCRNAKINAKGMLLEVARQFDETAMIDFLDRIETGKIPRNGKSLKRDPNGPDNPAAKNDTAKPQKPSFSFVTDAFRVELVFFDEAHEPNRDAVFAALKHACDEVANERVDI